MSKKGIETIALLLLVGILILAIAMWLMSAFGTSPELSSRTLAAVNCHTVRSYLLKYYREVGNDTPADRVSDFVTYVTDAEKKLIFSREPPIEPYTSRRDIGFYLLLPDKLESVRPVPIGYTTPITTKAGQIYRGILFMRGQQITTVILQEKVWKNIIGNEDFEKKKPDLYIWRERLNYLKDQSQKRK